MGVITDGLLSCWDMGNRSSFRQLDDVSEPVHDIGLLSNDLTLMNSLSTTGDAHGCAIFQAVNQRMQTETTVYTSTQYDLNVNDFTIGCWFRYRHQGETTRSRLVDHSQTSDLTAISGWSFYVEDDNDGTDSNRLSAAVGYDGTIHLCESNENVFLDGQWTYGAMVHNRLGTSTSELYINGGSVALNVDTAGVGSRTFPTSENLTVGNVAYNNSRTFNGEIAVVQVYNRALEPFEVNHNYQSTKGRFEGRDG